MLVPHLPDDVSVDFWGPFVDRRQLHNDESIAKLDILSYMDYYQRQWKIMTRNGDGRYITIRTYDDINDIIHLMREGNTRESISSTIKNRDSSFSDDAIENSINLSARLLLMLKIGVAKNQAIPRGSIPWESGSLFDLVQKRFNQPQVLDIQHSRLPKSFNAWAIYAIGGI